jgi:hypothetical protein
MKPISSIFIYTPIITATYWSVHISCLRLFMCSHFHKSALLFHLLIIPTLHITIDILLSRLSYSSLDLSVSPYPLFHLPIILLINHILPSNINHQLFFLYMNKFISSDLDWYWRTRTSANSPPDSHYSKVNPTTYHDLNTCPSGLLPSHPISYKSGAYTANVMPLLQSCPESTDWSRSD